MGKSVILKKKKKKNRYVHDNFVIFVVGLKKNHSHYGFCFTQPHLSHKSKLVVHQHSQGNNCEF